VDGVTVEPRRRPKWPSSPAPGDCARNGGPLKRPKLPSAPTCPHHPSQGHSPFNNTGAPDGYSGTALGVGRRSGVQLPHPRLAARLRAETTMTVGWTAELEPFRSAVPPVAGPTCTLAGSRSTPPAPNTAGSPPHGPESYGCHG
jgi:hypothetical protein